MTEQWRDIPGYEGLYQVSDMGQVKRSKGNRRRGLLKGNLTSRGYYYVKLFKDGRGLSVAVHRLVMLAFNPVLHMDLLIVNHLNGIKTDNRFPNLVWTTQRGNAEHYREVLNKAQDEGLISSESFINIPALLTSIDQSAGTLTFQINSDALPIEIAQGLGLACRLTVHLTELAGAS